MIDKEDEALIKLIERADAVILVFGEEKAMLGKDMQQRIAELMKERDERS